MNTFKEAAAWMKPVALNTYTSTTFISSFFKVYDELPLTVKLLTRRQLLLGHGLKQTAFSARSTTSK